MDTLAAKIYELKKKKTWKYSTCNFEQSKGNNLWFTMFYVIHIYLP